MVVAYVELMLLTSLISYLAARIVVRGYSHSVIVVFLLCLLQAFFSFSLIWGVKRERLEFLLISVASLGVRLIFAATYLVAIVATHIVPHYTNHLSSQYTTNVLQEMGGSETFTRRSSTEHCNLINTRERLKSVAVTNTLYENSDESENEG
ncbi:hypothetical protein Tcan_13721 [Toxocara canis]|uniref:Transmembrane protein n=1 Tax=Toxocara canis TaxID=6265 RepID=A0A0B2UZT2_TOXCA|nr:hypothetical protein Tcan_13721 [Toxocara canis]